MVDKHRALRLTFSPSSSSSSLSKLFRNIVGLGAKEYITDYQTANTVQLYVAIKGNFSGLFFF